MAVQPLKHKFTVAEYHEMGEACILKPDVRTELIEGEIYEMPPVGRWHGWCVDQLNRLFFIPLVGLACLRVQGPIILHDCSEPLPDLTLLRPRPDFYRDTDASPQDVLLLNEVVATTIRYDRGVKLPLYARNGIPEVWLVEQRADVVSVYREPTPGGYRVSLTCRRGERIAPVAFPQLELAVDDILG